MIAIANPDEYIVLGEYNPHHVRPWAFYMPCGNFYGLVGIAYSSNEVDALDIMADNGLLDSWRLTYDEEEQYLEDHWNVDYLGNASNPFDIEGMVIKPLQNRFSPQFYAERDERAVLCGQFDGTDSLSFTGTLY